jgi:hypothetical protein
MMSRRTFALGIGSAAVVWSRTARAQQKAMPVIGYLHFGSPGPFAYQLVAWLVEMCFGSGSPVQQNVFAPWI